MKLSSPAKLMLPILSVLVVLAILPFFSGNEIGSFSTVRASGEINQSVKVLVDSEKGFTRNQDGRIISFYARDKNNALATVNLEEPAAEALIDAQIVELFGHMHGDNFVGKRVTIVE